MVDVATSLDIRGLSQLIGKSNQDFRKAANDNSSNLSRIVKDIAKTFSQQRKDIGSLEDAIEESINEQQTTSMKIDRLANIFGESIALQSQMVVMLKNVGIGLDSINSNIVQMSSAIGTPGNPAEGTLLQRLSLLGAGAVVGGGAAAAMMGGGPQSEGRGQYTPEKAAALIRKAGGNEQEATVLGAISQPESSGDPTRINPVGRDYSFGLWQINLHPTAGGAERRRILGLAADGSEDKKLLDPEFNAKAALMLLRGQLGASGGYQHWSTFQAGSHRQFIEAAKKGATGETQEPPATKQQNAASTPAPPAPEPAATKQPEAQTQTKERSTQNPVNLSGTIPDGHGMISESVKDAEKVSSGTLPSGDIVALGNTLKSQGYDISEHPKFGGVAGVHHGRAHYEGRAIDINLTHGDKVEADIPAVGAKLDQLADQLSRMGYKIFWRGKGEGPYGLAGHRDHLHAEIPAAGTKTAAGEAMGMKAGLPPSRPEEYTQNIPTPPTRPQEFSGPQPSAEIAPRAGMPPELGMMMGMLGGLGGLAGMGNIGGMIGMAMPLIGGLLNALGSPEETPQMASPQQTASKAINEAAVQSQAVMEQGFATGTPNIPEMIGQGVQQVGRQLFASYNNENDLGWPEWAGNIGGWNWGQESRKIKYNMNQIG